MTQTAPQFKMKKQISITIVIALLLVTTITAGITYNKINLPREKEDNIKEYTGKNKIDLEIEVKECIGDKCRVHIKQKGVINQDVFIDKPNGDLKSIKGKLIAEAQKRTDNKLSKFSDAINKRKELMK